MGFFIFSQVGARGSLKGEQFLMSLTVNAKLLRLGCGISFICQGLQSVPEEQSKREKGKQTSNSDTL